MHRSPSRLKIVDLNPYLSCILCGGYFIDATTITECVHSFCRACIVRFLETSKYCPVCEVQVHKSRPLHYIRSDKTLQDIVYKLVPGLFHNEMKRRRELYASQPPEAIKESRDAEDRGECLDEKFIYAPDELFSLSVEYGSEVISQESSAESDDSLPKKRFLRCPAAITISHLKKFIRMKYGIPNTYQVVLQYDKESLRDEYTLMDIAYIFLWQRKGPMRFFYKIIERPPKIVKPNADLQESDLKTPDTMDPSTSEEDKSEMGNLKEDATNTSAEPPKVIPNTVPDEEENCPVNSVKVKCDQEKTVVVEEEETNTKKEVSKKPLKTEMVEKKETPAENAPASPCSKKEVKVTTTLKFLPTSCSKSSSSEKPAVMTVAPLTKPSTSLATTTSTTASTGTITHGLYTGISIKKSPPNTLPPFRISSHLLPPRVPPLKLSPPRFSKLETCLRQMTPKETSSKKSSSHSKKSKSSKSSIDKLESKVAQLKSASIKSIAPLVISVSHETKVDSRNVQDSTVTSEEKPTETPQAKPSKEETSTAAAVPESSLSQDTKLNQDDDKMDLDSDIFEGPLVIAEPDPPPKDDSEDSTDDKPTDSATTNGTKILEEDPEDEEIDVVDDGEVDSGRGSDISSRAEVRSLSGDDDLGSPESVPKTPESDHPQPISIPKPPTKIESSEPKAKIAKCNGVTNHTTNNNNSGSSPNASSECGVLDLSTCSRKRNHEGDLMLTHRSKQVANPAVLDKSRQTPCRSPELQSFKAMSSPVLPPINPYKIKSENNGRNFKCRGSNLTVINTDPNGNIPKIVIRKLGPRPDRGGHERFHHHHNHNHHHHHQRM